MAYCSPVDQGRDWAAHLAAGIGKRVSHLRGLRKVSAQQLADRCAELGLPSLSRIVITKLENGRREAVSIAELLVLARALDTAPVLLAFPLGGQQETEVLPGQQLSTWDAVLWFSGQALLSETPHGLDVSWANDDDVVPLYHRHDQLVSEWEDEGRHASERLTTADGAVIMTSADFQKETATDIRLVRTLMRKNDLIPPPLPPELAHIDHQERSRGSR